MPDGEGGRPGLTSASEDWRPALLRVTSFGTRPQRPRVGPTKQNITGLTVKHLADLFKRVEIYS